MLNILLGIPTFHTADPGLDSLINNHIQFPAKVHPGGQHILTEVAGFLQTTWDFSLTPQACGGVNQGVGTLYLCPRPCPGLLG